ncbi:Bifunctional biotin operon repressor / biotin-[acetyl-CoA-carboxylase] ligase [Cyclonatronum proteinivorum]|uniref:Bifunctional biotin operon repressor / biotin-[acetyl-CoA-carboxylase] ligase n=1 Tax=Cyclonatronum proteinivorum TaxID=1457365 RepID=A0A345UN97_9BACT|nr:biotin--[acetyl-CoA-carboxylase] ligase [Cyclonatronum proteinivorum]AXJ01949.1 Bifunctional biotin operon repressor / biotin-[acetyl-CoA-carboxylase] ligase [Cyclonatronum proteinivorum]
MKTKQAHSDSQIDFIQLYQLLDTRTIGQDFWCFKQLPSTNTLVKKLPAALADPGLVCVAVKQYAGRGQRQNEWIAGKHTALTFSVVLKPEKEQSLHMLLQVAAYSVVTALKKCCAVNATLKWPNDVLIGGKKACGILAEGTFKGTELERFVIGIGINTNGQLPPELSDTAVNLSGILGRDVNHTALLAAVLNEFDEQYNRSRVDLKQQLLEINRMHRGYGQLNRVRVENKVLEGSFKFLGIDLGGYPVFLDESDSVRRFTKQDVRFEPLD